MLIKLKIQSIQTNDIIIYCMAVYFQLACYALVKDYLVRNELELIK